MSLAVELNFDKESSNRFKKLWTALKYHKICDFMADQGSEPRIAIMIFSEGHAIEMSVKNIFEAYFKDVVSFDLLIAGIGVVPSDANVVYLRPAVTMELLKLQIGLYEKLVEAGFGNYILDRYRPGQWMPRITMTMNINDTNMVDAIKLLKRKFKPFVATIEQIALNRFYPVENLSIIQLD